MNRSSNLDWKARMRAALVVVLAAGLASAASAQVKVDPELPEYKPAQGVSGAIKSVGSDTMNNLMTLWGEGFRRFYPSATIEIEGKGSSTAPPALVGGTATFGPMSREMKEQEIDQFEAKFGYEPAAIPVAIDMLAVYVNKDNPIEGLSLVQVDAMYSSNRKGGHPTEIRLWGDLGLTGEWANKPIALYGRNEASGTYGYFKDHALFGGDFKPTVRAQPGSSSVVQSVGGDRFAIGYSGIGYRTADVRPVPLSAEGGEFVAAEVEHAYSGDYPLARPLLVYMNARPGAPLDPLRREFVRYVFSREGQEAVVRDGYIPVPAALARESLESIGIEPGF